MTNPTFSADQLSPEELFSLIDVSKNFITDAGIEELTQMQDTFETILKKINTSPQFSNVTKFQHVIERLRNLLIDIHIELKRRKEFNKEFK